MPSYITTSATTLTEFTSSIIQDSVNHTKFAAVAAVAGFACRAVQPVNTVITDVKHSH